MDGLGYTRKEIEEGFDKNIDSIIPPTLMQSRYWWLSIMTGLALLLVVVVFGLLTAGHLYMTVRVANLVLQYGFSFEVLLPASYLLLGVGLLVAGGRRALLVRKSRDRYVTLQRDDQPELYAFVEKVSLLMNMPAPSVIRLDAQVGLLLKSKELVFFQSQSGRTELIIGLPLFYSLSVRQLAGVIAHALSAYDVREGVNGYPFVAAVSGWLYQLSSVSTWTGLATGRFRWVRKCVYLLQWPFDRIAQQLFVFLYHLSNAISFNVSRAVDVIADFSSAQVTGSMEFRTTQLKLRALFCAQKIANKEMLKGLEEGRVTVSYVDKVVKLADSLALKSRSVLIGEAEGSVVPMSRSRVVDLARIVNVERKRFDASCFLLGGATLLIKGLDRICHDVSFKHYQWFGVRKYQDFLRQISVHNENNQNVATQSAAKDLSQVFFGWESCGRYIRIKNIHSSVALSTESRVQDLQSLRVKLSRVQSQVTLLSARHGALSKKIEHLYIDKTLIAVKLHLTDEGDRVNLSRLKKQEVSWLRSLNDEGALQGDLSYYEALLAQRLSLSLSLAVQNKALSRRLAIGDMLTHVERLRDALVFMHGVQESVRRLALYAQILGKLLEWQCSENARLDLYINRYRRYCGVELDMIGQSLGAVSYPFFSDVNVSIGAGQRAVEGELLSITDVMEAQIAGFKLPLLEGASVSQVFKVSHSVLAFVSNLHGQLLSEVARITLDVEEYYNILD